MPKIIAAGVGLPLIGTGATVTTSQPLLDLSQRWNNAAVTFTGLKFNVTDTASDVASNLLDFQRNGTPVLTINKYGTLQAATLRTTGFLSFGSAGDTILTRDAPNTLAMRNGTAGQAFNIYNTYTDASNYERALVGFSGGNFYVATQNAGTGVARRTIFQTGGTDRWKIEATGELLAGADNVYDIGANGANRPRNIYAGTNLVAGGALFTAGSKIAGQADGVFRFSNNAGTRSVDLTVGPANLLTLNGGLVTGAGITSGGNVGVAGSNQFTFSGRGRILAPADGIMQVLDVASANFTRLILGTNDTSGIAIVKNAQAFDFKTGDAASFVDIQSRHLFVTNVFASGYVKTQSVKVSGLTAAATAGDGARSFVTDANATMEAGIGTAVVGGGANAVPVYSDGAAWRIG